MCLQVHEGDFFWDKNARQQFTGVAEDQSKQLAAYREAVDEINRKTGAGINPDAIADELQQVSRIGFRVWACSAPSNRLPSRFATCG